MEFDDGYPKIGRVFSDEMINLIETREGDEKINNKHKDIAASVQFQFEKALFNTLDHLGKKYPNKQLCMAGGCAQNSLANGKIITFQLLMRYGYNLQQECWWSVGSCNYCPNR